MEKIEKYLGINIISNTIVKILGGVLYAKE